MCQFSRVIDPLVCERKNSAQQRSDRDDKNQVFEAEFHNTVLSKPMSRNRSMQRHEKRRRVFFELPAPSIPAPIQVGIFHASGRSLPSNKESPIWHRVMMIGRIRVRRFMPIAKSVAAVNARY